MRAIDRKLVRDVLLMKGQVLAICAVMACGVATFVMSSSAMVSLQGTMDGFYESNRFPQVFARIKRAPLTVAERMEEIPGVARIQTRVVEDVTLDVPSFPEPVAGRLVSIPEHPEPTDLCSLFLRKGRFIEPRSDDEVLASEGFVKAHKLQLNDQISAVINGKKKKLRIVGVALSPEYVYQIKYGQLVPDDKRFGILWMSREALEAAFDMKGAFNDVLIELLPGASEDEVVRRLDRIIEKHGGFGSHARADQISHRFLNDEISNLKRMGMIVPAIFLGVAAFLLNVVLSRIIALQRDQIAALKAFGYSHWAVGRHYLKLVLLICVIGGIAGTIAGAFIGRKMMGIYAEFYRYPELHYQLPPQVIAGAFGVCVVASMIGTLNVVRRAVTLPPAEAMRPEAPGEFRPTIFERLGFANWLSQIGRIVIRNIERRPVKALLSVCGIAMAAAILVLGRFSADSLDWLVRMQFEHINRHDIDVTLMEPTSRKALHEIQQLPGVIHAEPRRGVGVKIFSDQVEKRTYLLGIDLAATLNHLIDDNDEPVAVPPEGIVLNQKLAQVLGVRIGDTLTLEIMEGSRRVRPVRVAALSQEYLGTVCYMEARALNRLVGEGPAVTSIAITADPNAVDDLYRRLKATPRVASVMLKGAAIQGFRDTVMNNLLTMQAFNVVFACIIAFGVVYNTARVALSERGRELASLRVLGLTRAEISRILLGELAILTCAAIPLGLFIGNRLAGLVCWFMDTELYRIPLIIEPATYSFATTVVLIAAILSGLLVRRRLDHLDLIAVLKTRE
ncbi:MAG: FtsX-like permease family protein [Planctomycetaceae bacterium]|nr:FtsX-like permease family protein [Planctomycetaceae bacterium]